MAENKTLTRALQLIILFYAGKFAANELEVFLHKIQSFSVEPEAVLFSHQFGATTSIEETAEIFFL